VGVKAGGALMPRFSPPSQPFPATASAEGRQFNGAPFPASATAEGRQFNGAPSLWEGVETGLRKLLLSTHKDTYTCDSASINRRQRGSPPGW